MRVAQLIGNERIETARVNACIWPNAVNQIGPFRPGWASAFHPNAVIELELLSTTATKPKWPNAWAQNSSSRALIGGAVGTTRINEWLQILASLGVLAGLVFLALEIQQANRIAIASTEIAIREGFGSLNETIYTNQETATFLAKARVADADFSGTEREQVDAFIARLINIWSGIEKAYVNEMISRQTFDEAIEDMQWTVDTYPSMRPYFEDYVRTYPAMSDSELARELTRYLEEK